MFGSMYKKLFGEKKANENKMSENKVIQYQEEYHREVLEFKKKMEKLCFDENEYIRRKEGYEELLRHIGHMNLCNLCLPCENKFPEDEIKEYENIYKQFKEFYEQFGERFHREITHKAPYLLIDMNKYGSVNSEYLQYILSLKKQDVDSKVAYMKNVLEKGRYGEVVEFDIKEIFSYMWFYALHKPYLSVEFNGVYEIYCQIYLRKRAYDVEAILAEIYPICQMGASNVMRDKITEVLKSNALMSQELIALASGLMWMKAYNEENMVLDYMLQNRMQLPVKLQERLHTFSNGGENAPSDYDVQSNKDQIYLDTASLAWNDSEYNNFFENLSFKEKVLTYSLAIRDENKDLFITQAMNLPDNTKICSKLMTVFQEEYGSQVVARNVEGIALSGSGSEKIPGILVRTKECKQLGIFLHIARIGKKLNIKFYTLFVPITNDIGEQRQQVISLYKKLSPTVTMWEDSLKDTILMAIQQLLNVAPKPEQQPNHPVEDEPVEF